MLKKLTFCAALVAAALCAPASIAQQGEPIKRALLEKGDFPGATMVTQLMMIEVIPNGFVARHTHPGGEVGYILDGEIEFTIGNAAPKTYKKGDSYTIPVKTPHTGKAGPAGAKLLGTFVVEKDQPLASPAP